MTIVVPTDKNAGDSGHIADHHTIDAALTALAAGSTGIPQTGGLANTISAATSASGSGPIMSTTGASDSLIPLILNPKGSSTASSTTLGATCAPVIIGGNPNGSSGLLVNDSTHNTGGIGYGSGVFNGAIQIFRPSSGAQIGMPWLLFGDPAGNELFTLGYATTPSADYFSDSAANDGVIRAFGLTNKVLIGPANTTTTQHSSLAVAGVGTAGTPQVNGVQIVGAASGGNPLISVIGTSTNMYLALAGKGTAGIAMYNGGGTGTAGLAAIAAGNTPASSVNYVSLDGSLTTVAPIVGISSISSDTNVDLGLGTKGTGVVDIRYATVALGGGAAPTLGTIGGSGPATAAQNSWLKVKINGTAAFLPVWH